MAENALFHPVVSQQCVQVLDRLRAFAFGQRVAGQVDVSAAPPRLGRVLAEQVGAHPAVPEGGVALPILFLPQRFDGSGGNLGVCKASGQERQALPVALMSLRQQHSGFGDHFWGK